MRQPLPLARKRTNAGKRWIFRIPGIHYFFSYLPVSSVTIAVIILCLVLILVFRAISGTVLALVLHAVLALVGTIIRAVLGCIFGAVFLGTVIIVPLTFFSLHNSFLLNSFPVRFSTCRFRLPVNSRLTVTFLLQVLVWNFTAKVCRVILTFYASNIFLFHRTQFPMKSKNICIQPFFHEKVQCRCFVNSFLTQHVHNLNRCAVVPWGSLDAGSFS